MFINFYDENNKYIYVIRNVYIFWVEMVKNIIEI